MVFTANERAVFRTFRDFEVTRGGQYLPAESLQSRIDDFEHGEAGASAAVASLTKRGFLRAEQLGPALTANGETASWMLADAKGLLESRTCPDDPDDGHHIGVTPQLATHMECLGCREVFTIVEGIICRNGNVPWQLEQ